MADKEIIEVKKTYLSKENALASKCQFILGRYTKSLAKENGRLKKSFGGKI